MQVSIARIFHQLVRKIGQGFDWLKVFLCEWNNGVYFRAKKNLQAIKDSARAQQSGEISGFVARSGRRPT
jgi:hypothetical protein